MLDMTEQDLRKVKSILFVVGGTMAALIGMYFSKTGFGFEIPEMAWIGWILGILCFIVQIAFSSQLAYRSYNYVLFLCGVLAYIYSGWSNYIGIMSINPNADWRFALLLAEFIDWIAEPLIVFGLIGVSENAEGDFLRNLLGIKSGGRGGKSQIPSQNINQNKQNQNQNQQNKKYVPQYRPNSNQQPANFASGNNKNQNRRDMPTKSDSRTFDPINYDIEGRNDYR